MDRVRFRAHERNTHVDEHGDGEHASNEYVFHSERKAAIAKQREEVS
jgi:hypothetical protein